MNLIKKPYNYICSISIALILLILTAGFVPQREGASVRRLVSTTFVKLGPADMPQPIINNNTGWSMRTKASTKVLSTHKNNNVNSENSVQWLNFSDRFITLHTTYGAKDVESGAHFAKLINASSKQVALHAVQPISYGEALSVDGTPLRWTANASDMSACSIKLATLEHVHKNLVANLALPPKNESTRAKVNRYRPLVSKAAKRFNLSESLLFAIIQTESSFSPSLVSSQSAMGLMQLLPSTAGGEVHRYLHGHTATMTLDDLSNPDVNILFGATYMHLLLTRHLGGIQDPKSRQYCALAAYNMGPGRLIRFFGSNQADAINKINSLTSNEVYHQLTTVLPIAETRSYVAKVTDRQAQFEEML